MSVTFTAAAFTFPATAMPRTRSLRVFWFLVWMMGTEEVCLGEDPVDGPTGGSISQVDWLVSQVVEKHLAGCHLVLATTTDQTSVFSLILK